MGLFTQLIGWAHLYQRCDEVLVREPGTRAYDDSQNKPVKVWAQQEWELAALSEIVYAHNWGREGCVITNDPVCSPPDGWTVWEHFPSSEFIVEACKEGLYFEVWQSAAVPQKVVVAFRGTDFTSLEDWKTNLLHWLKCFVPFVQDQYTLVSKKLTREFHDELLKRIHSGTTAADAIVTATGHSLGGGLAQHFAYASRAKNAVSDPPIPQIEEMTVFDPSPITGWTTLSRRTRNAKGLNIDRVFEHGEVLSYIRLAISLVWPPSARNPAIREIRFNFDPSVNFIENHSMHILARGLREAAQSQSQDPQQNAVQPAQPQPMQ